MNTVNKGKTAKILIVDDNAPDREVMKRALRKGKVLCEVNDVADGEQALLYLKNLPPYDDKQRYPTPDLVLLDINMPRLDGLQVLEAIRADQNLRRLPVVVLSSSDRDADILNSYKFGVNAYVRKPVDSAEFIAAIQKLESFWLELVVLPPREV